MSLQDSVERYKDTYLAWAEAFTIFAKYKNENCKIGVTLSPTRLYCGPDPNIVSTADTARLKNLGWKPDYHYYRAFYQEEQVT